mmetsp:Transcript_36642/g.80294  ORF Transcript_36642/g.80294 Transcript_36642/m.80294 type:complete len:95 (+) Transcript_36642:24-308(+)
MTRCPVLDSPEPRRELSGSRRWDGGGKWPMRLRPELRAPGVSHWVGQFASFFCSGPGWTDSPSVEAALASIPAAPTLEMEATVASCGIRGAPIG